MSILIIYPSFMLYSILDHQTSPGSLLSGGPWIPPKEKRNSSCTKMYSEIWFDLSTTARWYLPPPWTSWFQIFILHSLRYKQTNLKEIKFHPKMVLNSCLNCEMLLLLKKKLCPLKKKSISHRNILFSSLLTQGTLEQQRYGQEQPIYLCSCCQR